MKDTNLYNACDGKTRRVKAHLYSLPEPDWNLQEKATQMVLQEQRDSGEAWSEERLKTRYQTVHTHLTKRLREVRQRHKEQVERAWKLFYQGRLNEALEKANVPLSAK